MRIETKLVRDENQRSKRRDEERKDGKREKKKKREERFEAADYPRDHWSSILSTTRILSRCNKAEWKKIAT